jgi:adenosine deaminase
MSVAHALAGIPKVELHCHYLGTMRASTCAELASKNGVKLPVDVSTLYARINSRSRANDHLYANTRIPMFQDWDGDDGGPAYGLLEASAWVAGVIHTRDDFARVAYESLIDAADDSNIVYREMFFEPTLYYPYGVAYQTIVDGIIDGIRAAERERRIRCALIAGIDRSESAEFAESLVREVIQHRRDEVIGIGLESVELAGAPEKFARAYRLAGDAGLHRTAHAGEHVPTAANVATCLDLLGCERIDHGYFIMEDDAVVARCRDQGIYFNCAFTTSRRAWQPWRRASVKAMVEAGLRVTINSDDPAMFPTTVTRELEIAADEIGFDWPTLRQIVLNAVDASWLDPGEKSTLRARMVSAIDGQSATGMATK